MDRLNADPHDTEIYTGWCSILLAIIAHSLAIMTTEFLYAFFSGEELNRHGYLTRPANFL